MNNLNLIGRKNELFTKDISDSNRELSNIIENSSFLILGAAGSIGQALSKEIFYRNPKKLHIVDISENNLVELVRDIRSSTGYIDGEFKSFALDIGSIEFIGERLAIKEFNDEHNSKKIGQNLKLKFNMDVRGNYIFEFHDFVHPHYAKKSELKKLTELPID